MIVKFATYNIQYGVGQGGRYDLTRAVQAVRDCDVICLQEVTTNWRVCNRDMQPEILAKALNHYAVYAPAYESDDSRCDPDGVITNARCGFGNMVNFPRTALEVTINFDGTPLRIFSVHLSHLPGVQQHTQVNELAHLVRSLPAEAPLWEDDPRLSQWCRGQAAPGIPQSTLVFGDFNFEPNNALYSAMLDPLPGLTGRLVDGWVTSGNGVADGQTCVEDDGRLSRLDYLFATEDMRANIQSARVDLNVRASDHFPVYFEINIQGDR